MAKKRPGVAFAKGQRFCIFCGGPGLSKTHIWPKWLNELLGPDPARIVELERPLRFGGNVERRLRQGSIFSQKPYLACEVCNNSLGTLEDKMKAFAPPLFSTNQGAQLSVDQQRTLAGWIALITILAEHIDSSSSAIPKDDVAYVRDHREPPAEWTIVCASVDGKTWAAKYRHRPTFIGQFSSMDEFKRAAARPITPSNTQTTSFGVGGLFFQVFTCPDPRLVADFRRYAEIAKLGQVWPIPASIFAHRTLKLPTDLILTDEAADRIADAYDHRIRQLTSVSAI